MYVIITGSFLADASNWSIPAEDIPADAGSGGFAPFGISGIIKGAAICFYGFIGFDVIATAGKLLLTSRYDRLMIALNLSHAGEETKNPKKSVPISVIASLSIIFSAYFTLSTVLTMMLPYYEQNVDAPLVMVFRNYNWIVAEYIVSIGAVFGLCASLMGSMFPLPRVIYAMSIDGLLFHFMGVIHPRFKTPMIGTLLAGLMTGKIRNKYVFHLFENISV